MRLSLSLETLAAWIGRACRSAVLWGFLVTLTRALGFFLVMAYALRSLSPEGMGLWYVMQNLAALAVAVEFGFNPTLGRFASFYQAGAARVPRLGLESPGGTAGIPNHAALAGLVLLARRLYLGFGAAVAVLMMVGGMAILYGAPQAAAVTRGDLGVFVFYALGTGLNMAGLFWYGLLYGLNRVRAFNVVFLIGLLASYALSCAGLRLGWGLLALAAGQILMNAIPRWLSRRQVLRLIHASGFEHPQRVALRELWPMTWRSGTVTLAMYLCLQITTLLCARIADLSTTASYGLSLQLALMLHLFAANWLSVKYPQLSVMRVAGESAATRRLVLRRMGLGLVTFLAGAAAILWLGPLVLRRVGSQTALLPRPQLMLMLAMVALDFVLGMHAAVMQTENRVPHLWSYGVSGLLTVGLGVWLGSRFGVTGLILAPILAHLVWNAWWTPWRCWRGLMPAGSAVPRWEREL